MALDKQIGLFKVDTNAFLSDEEKKYKKNLLDLQKRKRDITNELRYLKANDNKVDDLKLELSSIEDLIKKEKKIYKVLILNSSAKAVKYNNEHKEKHIRKLDENYLTYINNLDGRKNVKTSNVVSMFESTLTRSFGIKTNDLTYDIFIVEIYFYDIAKDLVINGFDYNDKHYVYFSSSAGQIRTKKAVFVEEQLYDKCKNKLMCGLTVDKINELGGMNINKFLVYLGLSNSATDLWEDVFEQPFDIDKTIVVDDFETMVKGIVDNIDYTTYEITKNVTQKVPIPHTDGVGMILNTLSNKNFMIRLPFLKGLLGSFDFVRFINENECNGNVTDIWGKEYNIIDDDIQIIFTKSQLKMYKYYESWDEYKTNFKKYNCEASICNMEDDKLPNATINYQMLQTLYDMTDDEIADICKTSNDKILNISDSLENMLGFFGIYQQSFNNYHKNYFQKSLQVYPELINDISNKNTLKELKTSMVKKYKSGKLEVLGKFTFVLPDLYAFCEHLFLGIKKPKGLLKDGEVICKLYKNYDELDCLRSPSLYIEHAVRKNVYDKKYRKQRVNEWFTTTAIYTSSHDLISKTLQFDVDGDKLLVLAQPNIVKIAKRCMEGVNPLYYEMKKAKSEIINEYSIYEGLRLAFTGGNIGAVSNDITKIWNMDNIGEQELTAIRWLCMETNFTIDYAKTLFKPTRPKHVDGILKKYHNMKVPYFFYYAKGKTKKQVEKINNSTMNRICNYITVNKMMFKSIKNMDKTNYKIMLSTNKEYFNKEIDKRYIKWNKKYGFFINFGDSNKHKNNLYIIQKEVLKDLHEIEKDDIKILSSLVKLLYEKKSLRKKNLLWLLYGEQIYNNIKRNIGDDTEICMQCGKRVDKGILVNQKCKHHISDIIKQNGGYKIVKCIDCGVEFKTNGKTNENGVRCNICSEKAQKERYKVINKKRAK